MSTDIWTLEHDLCRCCHAEGVFNNLAERRTCDEKENYSDMLKNCFEINVLPVTGTLCKVTYTICENCITRLKDAFEFMIQVKKCEEKFKDLYNRNSIIAIKKYDELNDQEDGSYLSDPKEDFNSLDSRDTEDEIINVKAEESKGDELPKVVVSTKKDKDSKIKSSKAKVKIKTKTKEAEKSDKKNRTESEVKKRGIIMVRGVGRGGRGMPGRGGMGRPPFNRPRVLMLRPPFDLILAEPAFPRCKPAPDDSGLTQALLKRHAELCPTPSEQAAVLSLVTKLQTVLDNLVVAPGDFAACQLEEVRQVGSYKKGTMMAGKNVADIVVIMKTLPTKEAVEGLSNKVNEEVNKLTRAEGTGTVTCTCNERGFSVSATGAAVRVLVTTLHQNLRKLEPEVHLDYKVISSHLAAIRHSRWFEENAHHSSIKVLIRLLRDMCARHAGLEPLTPWMIDLLAHHCIMNNPARQALPINVAFRRSLALLAGGLFLPGCAGLPDPCEAAHARAHTALDLAAQDHAAATAQTLLRVVARGGHRYVLGLQPFEGGKDISTEITVWDGVVVSPLAPAYQEAQEAMDTDDKEDDCSPDGVAA